MIKLMWISVKPATSKIKNICLNVRQVKFKFKFISQFCTVFPCNPCHCDDTYSPTLLSPHLQWHLTFTWRLAPPHIERHVGIKTSAIVTCRYFIRSNICHFWWFQLVRHVVICGVIRYKLHLPTYVSVVTGETEVACYTPPHTQTHNSSKPNALINFQWLWGTYVFAFELMCTIYERLLLHCIVLHWHNGMTLHNYEVPKYGFLEISH